MVVMLASAWITNGDVRGDKLLNTLKQIIPAYKLSTHNIKPVALRDLEIGSEMMKAEAHQWKWRMGDLTEPSMPNKRMQAAGIQPVPDP